jgi:hypothetical protein
MDVKKIKDDQQYHVDLVEKVELFGQTFYPGQPLTLRGDVLKTVAERVKDAQPV